MYSSSRFETDATTSAGAELRSILAVLRERWWVVVLVIAIAAGAAYFRASREQHQYRASALLTYDPTQSQLAVVGGSLTGLSTTPDAATIATNLAALAKLGTTSSVRILAERRIGPINTPVSVSADLNSDVVTVNATAPSPPRSAQVANAWANALVAQRLAVSRRAISVSIAEVKAQLPSARDKRSLNAELSALRTLYGIQQSDLQLKQRATPPNHAVSPKPLRDAGIGGVAGLLLALLLLGVLEALDRRLKSLADVDRDVQTGMLAVLPPTDPRKLGKGLIDARTVDAFQQLQANMMFASRDEDVRTIAVTSAVAKEGKSTLALGLAISLGGSGRRVLLIDADFRRPTISHVLGVRPGDSSLSLIEDPDRTPTPVRFDLRWVRGDAKPGVVFSNGAVKLQSFDFVSAGPVRTAAFNFFSTARFADYLHTCREAYDYVIIDTAPLLPVSDTAPIVTQADAVMLAARLKHSRRDTIGHAIDLIAQADARLLGVVTATSARELKQGYGYGYGYSARGVAAGRYIIAPRQAAPPVESGHQG